MSSSGFETLDRAKGVFAGQFTKWRAAVPCGHWQDPITVLVEKSVPPDRREPWRVPAPVGKSSNYISSLLLGRPQRHLTQVAGSTERREAGSTERREAGSTTRREAGANQLQACSCPYRKNRQAPAGPRPPLQK